MQYISFHGRDMVPPMDGEKFRHNYINDGKSPINVFKDHIYSNWAGYADEFRRRPDLQKALTEFERYIVEREPIFARGLKWTGGEVEQQIRKRISQVAARSSKLSPQ
jgi:hypothetical protein